MWEAYQKEKQTNQLLLIPKTLYEDIGKFINETKEGKSIDPLIRDNTITLANNFFEKRKQKLMIYVAYNKQPPQPISSNELEFYNRLLQIFKAEKLDLANGASKTKTLKSLRDIPEIILPSGNKIGPLKKDQIVETESNQDRSYLTENAICEIY